jgi:outer membrane protein TolC
LALLAGCARYEPRPLAPAAVADSLDRRSLSDPALKSFLEKNLHHELVDWPPKTWDFEMLSLAAFYYHPSLDVARADWHVAQSGERTAGGRPNPTVSVTPAYNNEIPGNYSPWMPGITFDIPIETAGKREKRIEQAQHLSESARFKIAATAWQVRSDLRTGLLEYTAARARAKVLESQLKAQQQIVALLEQRLQVGAVARTELTAPRLALTRTGADFADATRLAIEARGHIAAAIGVSASAISGIEFEFPLPISDSSARQLTSAEARKQALLGRADILSALADYAASEFALRLEIAKQYPDVHLNPGYSWNPGNAGDNQWQLGFTVELPVLNRNEGPIAEAEAKREASGARFLALQAKVISDIDSAIATRASAQEQLERQGQLLKLAHEQAAAVSTLFKAGAADKLELASAELEASATELASVDARVRAQQADARLEDAVQRPLPNWPKLEQGRIEQASKHHP